VSHSGYSARPKPPRHSTPNYIYTAAAPFEYALNNDILSGKAGSCYYPDGSSVPHIHLSAERQLRGEKIKVNFVSIKEVDDIASGTRIVYNLRVENIGGVLLYRFRGGGLPPTVAARFKELLVKLKICHER
jgi:hypothetical protein